MTLRSDQPRRRVLALVLPLAAGLLMVGGALIPKGLDKPISSLSTALKELSIAATQPNRFYASNLLVLLGLGGLGISFASMAALLRQRGSVVATTAAVIGGFTGLCGVIVNVLIGYNLAAAATSHSGQYAAASPRFGQHLGVVRVVLRWLPRGASGSHQSRSSCVTAEPECAPVATGTFASGLVLAALAPPGIASILLTVPFAAAMVVLAVRI